MSSSLKKCLGKKDLIFVVRKFKAYQEIKATMRAFCFSDVRRFCIWRVFVVFFLHLINEITV